MSLRTRLSSGMALHLTDTVLTTCQSTWGLFSGKLFWETWHTPNPETSNSPKKTQGEITFKEGKYRRSHCTVPFRQGLGYTYSTCGTPSHLPCNYVRTKYPRHHLFVSCTCICCLRVLTYVCVDALRAYHFHVFLCSNPKIIMMRSYHLHLGRSWQADKALSANHIHHKLQRHNAQRWSQAWVA